METAPDSWIAKCAAAMCAAARWLFAASLALAFVALVVGGFHGGCALVALLGIPQVYVAMRVEFDHGIFQALSVNPDGAADFDAAMRRAGLSTASKAGRAMGDRARGATRFVAVGAALFMTQVLVAAAIPWLP